MSKLKQSKRGAVLIPAVVCVMTVAALSTVYLQLSLDNSREARTAVDQKKAFYVAEAGLAEAFYGIASGESGTVAGPDQPAAFGGGVFWVEAEDLGGGKVSLTSTGLVGTGRSSLSITLERNAEALGKLGLFSERDMQIGSGALVDSYDSELGSYASQVGSGGSQACVASNANIHLTGKPGARVNGDAQPGPQGSVFQASTAHVSGSIAPAQELRTLAEVDVPVPTSATDFDHNHTGSATLVSGDYGFDTWRVRGGGTLTVKGPAQIVVDQLLLEEHSRLIFDNSGGAITVWVRSRLDAAAGTTLSTTTDQTGRFSLLVAAGNAVVASAGTVHGLVYAPLADLQWPSGLELFGAMAARTLTIASGARLHYDRALGRLPDGADNLPRQVCWRVMELPDVPLVTMKFDPLTVLKLNNVEPLKAVEAHVEAVAVEAGEPANTKEQQDPADKGASKRKQKGRRDWTQPRKGGL